jgi:hypothetical protein
MRMSDQDIEQAMAEEAASRFADQDDEEAISLLMGHLKNHGKVSASQRPWRLLMDIYQAKEDKASFEQLASMFTERFHTSPPSWRNLVGAVKPPQGLGRNVLVVQGFPSAIHPEKRRDFLNASRDQGFCRLDLSRLEWPDPAAGLPNELDILNGLLGRMTRLRLKVMLMGDGALIQHLRQSVDEKRWSGDALRGAWQLLLLLLQWRGQQEEFERRAMAFADTFDSSPLGYETDAVLAMDEPTAPAQEGTPAVWDETRAQQEVNALRQQYESRGVARLDLAKVLRITYPAALAMSATLAKLGFDARRVEVHNPSEMLVALFDATGVTPQVAYMGRGR